MPVHAKVFNYSEVEDFVARLGLNKVHAAEYFQCSHRTIDRRFHDDPEFVAAWDRGIGRYREKVSERLERHAEKNPIVALAQANQPHILGWTNGKHEVSGTINHNIVMTPAESIFKQIRKEAQDLQVEQVKQIEVPSREARLSEPLKEISDVAQPDSIKLDRSES